MKREYKKVTISIMSLRTYKYNYYDVYTSEDLKEAYHHFNDNFNWFDGDWETSVIDYDYQGILRDDIDLFFRLLDDYEDIEPQDIVYLMGEYTEDEVREILDKGIYYTFIHGDNKIEAFRDYIKLYDRMIIPEDLESYINYEAILNDWECGGFDMRIIQDGLYLIVD